jgi:predicted dehydrogenase
LYLKEAVISKIKERKVYMKKVKVGVVGCGYWGPNLVRNLASLPDCEMEMFCDLNHERLAHMNKRFPTLHGTSDWHHMVNGIGLHAVVITTPVGTHYTMAKASLLAGKHTFIEKPMAASVAECEELIALAKKSGLVLMVGHTFLYNPAVRKVKEIIDTGEIGDIRYISARRLNLGLFQKDINVAWDLAPHDLSIILYILGEQPLAVCCNGTAHITHGVEDVTDMFLTFHRDRSAMIRSSWLDPRKVREMTIVGSKKMIVYDDLEPIEKIRIFDARVNRPPHYDTFAEFNYAYHYGDMHAPHIHQEEPLKIECQHFLDCIRDSREPLTGGKQGLEVVSILDASSQSLRDCGAMVTMPL